MRCNHCSGSMIFDQGHSLDPARLKCLSCGREERMPEEEKTEETKKLCPICGKVPYRGHHHERRAKDKGAIPTKKKLLPTVQRQETLPEKTTEMFKALRRAILVDFLEEIRGQL